MKAQSRTKQVYEPHMTQSSWLLMLHCKVAMLFVTDAISPAAAGAVPLAPCGKAIFIFIQTRANNNQLTLATPFAIFDLSTVN